MATGSSTGSYLAGAIFASYVGFWAGSGYSYFSGEGSTYASITLTGSFLGYSSFVKSGAPDADSSDGSSESLAYFDIYFD